MRPKFKTPEEVADLSQTERSSLLIPKVYAKKLRSVAKSKNVPISALINEAIRAYCEFLEESQPENNP